MFLKRITHTLVPMAALLLSIGGGTNAFGVSTFDLNKTQPFGNSWNTAADWDIVAGPGPAPPVAGDTANTNGFNLRTPTASDTFLATLNIANAVILKTTGTATIADGHLIGGSLNQGIAPNSTGSFGGNIAVDSTSGISLSSTATDIRTMILAANLSGSGDLNVDGGNGAGVGTLRLTGDNSAYTGAYLLSDMASLQVQGSALSIGVNNSNGFEASGGPVSFGTGGETMDIGRNTAANTPNIVSTVDLTGATSVQMNLGTLRIGTSTANPGAQAAGILQLSQAGNNVINAGTIVIGDSPGAGNTANASLLSLGGGLNTIDTTTMTISGRKSNASVSFGTPGGVLNLGSAGDRVANLRIGFNDANGTGANTNGHLDGSGGTINAFVTTMELGQHNGPGSGSGKGTLTFENGTFDVINVILGQPEGNETGSNELNTTGTLNLAGGTFKAGSISKGLGTAVVNFTGSVLAVDNFNLDMDQQGGTLAPGMDMMIGSTNIDGDYDQQAGILSIDVDGIPGNNDVVNVAGDATLDGLLKLVALGGFTPLVGSFDVLFATSIDLGDNFDVDISMFNNRGASAVVVDDGNGGQILRVQLVPEPTTGLLAVFGFGALAARRRRLAA